LENVALDPVRNDGPMGQDSRTTENFFEFRMRVVREGFAPPASIEYCVQSPPRPGCDRLAALTGRQINEF
jgi:hypothetical protein